VSGASRRTLASRLGGAALALVLLGVMMVASNALPDAAGKAGTIAATGFLLLLGSAAATALEPLGFPHLTAYLLAGVVAGPHLLGVVDHEAVQDLQGVNALALALIALAGGAELKLDSLRRGLRGLGWATLLQNAAALLGMAAVFALARPLVPFARDLPLPALLGVALLWGVVAITRSPSATLGILAQTRARGPLTSFSVNFVMTSDVVVVIVLAAAITLATPLLEPGATLSLQAFGELGHELLGSVAIGTTLGLGLALYLRFVGKQVMLLLVALGLVFTHLFTWLRFDWLLIFIAAGFVVQNLSRQGPRFLHAIERTGEVVYVIFFATAGAHLDLPLLAQMWPAALLLAGSRGALTAGAAWLSARVAGDPPALRRWGWAALVSQAGLALGIAARVSGEFPGFGPAFGALAVAVVSVNEMIGPVVFKAALDRTGESGAQRAEAPAPAGPEPA
jgi:Kef-type K+ transport system membrane component KefB